MLDHSVICPLDTQLDVQIKILNKKIEEPPKSSTPMSAGYDVVAAVDEPIILAPDRATLIPLGIAIFINRKDVAALLVPRSGRGHKEGLVLGNLVGVIDGDYQQQWYASAWNRGQRSFIEIQPYERIAQILFVPVLHPTFHVVEEFSEETIRGLGGFGSTGV